MIKKIQKHLIIFLGIAFLFGLGVACITIPTNESESENGEEDAISETAEVETEVVVEEEELNEAEQSSISNANRSLRIIAIQHGQCSEEDVIWCDYERSMQTAAEQLDIALDIRSPNSFNVDAMVSLLNAAIAEEPDGIAISISDPDRLKVPLESAIQRGIPVVAYAFGTGADTDGIPYITYFGQDNYISGIVMGNELRARLSSDFSDVACVIQTPVRYWEESRCAGLADSLAPFDVSVEIVLESQDPTFPDILTIDDFVESRDSFATEEIILVTTNGEITNRVYNQFDQFPANVRSKLFHSTFDRTQTVDQGIRDGVTNFVISPETYSDGFAAIRTLAMTARYGLQVPLDQLPTVFETVDLTNIDDVVEVDASTSDSISDEPLYVIEIQHAVCEFDTFWCVVEQGAKDAAEDLNIDLQIRGPDGSQDASFEVAANLINEAIAEQPDAIIVTIPDRELFEEPIGRAEAAGIPVIAINSGAGPNVDNLPYLSLIAQDEYLAGVESALRLSQKTTSTQNRGVCLNHAPGLSSTENRCRGFLDSMGQLGITVDVVNLTQNPDEIGGEIAAYIEANPETNIFLTLGPTGAHPFYAYLDRAEIDINTIIHGTFDLSPQIRENIVTGLTSFSVDQQPYLQGYIAMEAVHLLIRHGVEPPLNIYPTGPGFITAENIEAVGMLSGLYR